MYKFFLLFCLLYTSAIYAGEWSLQKQTNNIDIYQQENKETYATTKGTTKIAVPLEALIAVLDDETACKQWVFNCLEREKVKIISPNTKIERFVTKFPYPLKNRELYSLIKTQLNNKSQNKIVTIHMTAQDGYTSKPNMILIKNFDAKWIFEEVDTTSTKVTYEVYSDPLVLNFVPIATINKEMVKNVYYTLNNLSKIVTKPQYLNKKFTKEEIKNIVR